MELGRNFCALCFLYFLYFFYLNHMVVCEQENSLFVFYAQNVVQFLKQFGLYGTG